MDRILGGAAILSGFVVLLAVGCARSADFDLDGDGEGPSLPFYLVLYLAANFAAIPLAVIWLFVLVSYLRRRAKERAEDDQVA